VVTSGGWGGGVVVKATVAEWFNAPDLPVTVMVALPAGAVPAAVNMNGCDESSVRLRLAGLKVKPAGRPVTVTAMISWKPPIGVILTSTLWLAPGVISRVVGVTAMVKLGGVLPQPQTAKHNTEPYAALAGPDGNFTFLTPELTDFIVSRCDPSLNLLQMAMATVAYCNTEIAHDDRMLRQNAHKRPVIRSLASQCTRRSVKHAH